MISKRIKELRKSLRLTKAKFASKLEMSSSAVYEWEHAKVKIKPSSLLLIELVFNVNPQWLRKGKGKMFLPSASTELEPALEWIKSLSEKDSVWLRIELEHKFPQFKEWISKNNE